MDKQTFISEFGYSIILPDNWSEYELEDEDNTNGFFDTSNWTGNLRITALNIHVETPNEFVKDSLNGILYKEFKWNKVTAFNYSETSEDLCIYYWYLTESDNIYICSFTIEIENINSERNKKELIKVEEILKSIKTNEI